MHKYTLLIMFLSLLFSLLTIVISNSIAGSAFVLLLHLCLITLIMLPLSSTSCVPVFFTYFFSFPPSYGSVISSSFFLVKCFPAPSTLLPFCVCFILYSQIIYLLPPFPHSCPISFPFPCLLFPIISPSVSLVYVLLLPNFL